MSEPLPDLPEAASGVESRLGERATELSARNFEIAALFREHNEMLVQFLTGKLRSRQEAREVAQEAYVRILSLDAPGAVSFLRAFLFKTASNIAVDRIRHRERCPHTADASLFDEGTEEVELLERIVAELPPKCRRAFLLCKLDGLSTHEIGRRMHLSERQVRDYILRGLLYCQEKLSEARGLLPKKTRGGDRA
jgi:RNA polymerase sigma-70 factor (ECF subfamily)